MDDSSAAEFRQALGVRRAARVAVTSANGVRRELSLDRPCAIIGRSTEADVPLESETVSFRHAYLQAIGDRVFCIDLFGPNAVRWEDASAHPWVTARRGLRVGDCKVELLDDGWASADPSVPSPLDYKPREGGLNEYGLLPQVELQAQNPALKGAAWPINRVVTLVGRDDRCRVTCSDDAVSRVHCSLVLLPSGLWVVDLLGKGGTLVNGAPTRLARLAEGSLLQVGPYKLLVHYVTPPATLPPPQAERAAFLTKLHKIFKVSWDGETLIVAPQGRSRDFRYQDIQVEANAIITILRTLGFRNLLVDFSGVKLTGSLIVDSVTQFCRVTTGMAAICNCSPEQYSALKDLNLISLWPCYPTLEDGLRAMRAAAVAPSIPVQG
jgi:pSer/pThr/pTyr-binding forkhead associated (FHA) protein